jgi:hypothetical protein
MSIVEPEATNACALVQISTDQHMHTWLTLI